jgi:hypothetical protein
MMDKHLTVLGALFLGLGAMSLIGLIVVLMIFGLASTLIGATAVEQGEAPAFVAAIPGIFGLLIATLISVGTIPNLFAGYGLIKRRPWRRWWHSWLESSVFQPSQWVRESGCMPSGSSCRMIQKLAWLASSEGFFWLFRDAIVQKLTKQKLADSS